MDIVYILNTTVTVLGMVIEYIGLALVAFSVFVSLIKVASPRYNSEHVRRHLAKRIMFGLEFIIAADILLATVATDMDDIFRLGAIVVIRVILGYSLRKEALLR